MVKQENAGANGNGKAGGADGTVVERIVKFDAQNGVDWFLVKWKGCSENYNPWHHKAYLLATYPEFAKIRADCLCPATSRRAARGSRRPRRRRRRRACAKHGSSTPGTTDATALGDRRHEWSQECVTRSVMASRGRDF